MTLEETSPALVEALRRLGDDYGPFGVALAAAQLTDMDFLLRELTRERERPRLVAQVEDLDPLISDTDEQVYVRLDEVIDVIRGRLGKPQDAPPTPRWGEVSRWPVSSAGS